METEYIREVARAGSVIARDMSQGLGRLGFAAIALDWERPFLEGDSRPRATCYPGRGEAVGPRKTGEADPGELSKVLRTTSPMSPC